MEIKFKKISDLAIVPSQNTDTDAGYDLFSIVECTLKPGERVLVKTGVSCAIPQGLYGRIAPRSGLAYKYGIDTLAGVIDSGYRGEIGVVLINLGQKKIEINIGDKIAQLIIEKCHYVDWVEVDDLNDTDRNEGGFGSSG